MEPTQYAGFWKRFLASFLDGIILYIVGALVGFVIGLIFAAIVRTPEEMRAISSFVGLLIGWLYYAYMESSPKQATLGKQAMGIIVTDTSGSRISFVRATGRYFAKFISGFILLIGYIMAAFTEKKQALHDILASTLVLQRQ